MFFSQLKKLSVSFPEFIATLNISLSLVGYAFIAAFSVPFGITMAQSQTISVPYRITAALIAFLSIIIGVARHAYPKFTKGMLVYYVCFALFALRVTVDMFTDSTGYADFASTKVFGIMFSGLIVSSGIYFSFRLINFNLALLLTFFMSLFVLTVNLFGFNISTADMTMDLDNVRQEGSSMLFSISYANVGCVFLCILVSIIIAKNVNLFYKLLLLPAFYFPLHVIAGAASRSPIISILIVLGVFFSSMTGNVFFMLLLLSIFGCVIYVFKDVLINLLLDIAPLLGRRFYSMVYSSGYSERDVLAEKGIQECLNNPIFGSSTIKNDIGITPIIGYHSAFVDGFASLGIIGGGFVAIFLLYQFFILYKLFLNRKWIPHFWIVNVLFYYLIYQSFALGAFHVEPIFASTIMLTLLFYEEYYIPNKSNLGM